MDDSIAEGSGAFRIVTIRENSSTLGSKALDSNHDKKVLSLSLSFLPEDSSFQRERRETLKIAMQVAGCRCKKISGKKRETRRKKGLRAHVAGCCRWHLAVRWRVTLFAREMGSMNLSELVFLRVARKSYRGRTTSRRPILKIITVHLAR